MTKLQKAIKKKAAELGSLAELSRQSGIPLRTIEDWLSGARKPRGWSVEYIIKIILDTSQ